MKRLISNISLTLFIVAILNFISFIVGALYLGGDALNGEIKNGSCFLGSRAGLVAVSRGVWLYSYWHSISVFITHPVGAFAMLVYFKGRSRKAAEVL